MKKISQSVAENIFDLHEAGPIGNEETQRLSPEVVAMIRELKQEKLEAGYKQMAEDEKQRAESTQEISWWEDTDKRKVRNHKRRIARLKKEILTILQPICSEREYNTYLKLAEGSFRIQEEGMTDKEIAFCSAIYSRIHDYEELYPIVEEKRR